MLRNIIDKFIAQTVKNKSSSDEDIFSFKQTTTQTGIDLSVSFTGIGIGGSLSKSKTQQTAIINKPSILGHPDTNSKLSVKGSITLIGSKITGKKVDASASSLKEVAVLDQYQTKTSSTGISMGAIITWSGAICPYGSADRSLSNDEETITVDASITGNELIMNISTRERVSVTGNKKHKASSISGGASANIDGSINPFISASKEHGKKRYSIYLDGNLFDAVDDWFLPKSPAEKNNYIPITSNNEGSAIRSIVFLDEDNDNNNHFDIESSVAPETESKLKVIGEKIGKLIAEYNLEAAKQHAEDKRWFDDANFIGAIGYIWGSVYSDLKKSIPTKIKDLTAAMMALEDMSNNLEPNKDPMKVFNGLIEKNRQDLDMANGISPILEWIAKHTKSAYSSAVTEIKVLTAAMMALDDMSARVDQNTDPIEIFNGLIAENRQALDHANGIVPIFSGIAAGLNYATQGISSPTREVIEDLSILVGGFEAGKLTYQSGKFLFKKVPRKCPNPGNNFFKEFDQKIDLPNKNLYNLEVDFNKYPKINLGKLEPATKLKILDQLPDNIPEGRIDYRQDFVDGFKNSIDGTDKLFHGQLEKDLYLINYHDKNIPLGFGKGHRTMQWATHLNIDGKMPTTEHIHQHLALVRPDWGDRNAYSIIKIPKGEQVTFISGKAAYKESKTFEPFAGGGYQVRLRDFDEKWIIETKDLRK